MKNIDKALIYKLILLVIILGAIVPFFAQFILPFFFPKISIAGAEIWNQYVSIILGVVATIMSVVSLVLGFRSEEQSNATELRTRDLLKSIESNIEVMSQKQEQFQRFFSKNYSESNKAVSANLSSGQNKPKDEIID